MLGAIIGYAVGKNRGPCEQYCGKENILVSLKPDSDNYASTWRAALLIANAVCNADLHASDAEILQTATNELWQFAEQERDGCETDEFNLLTWTLACYFSASDGDIIDVAKETYFDGLVAALVSPIGWLCNSIVSVRRCARLAATIHSHFSNVVIGAEAVSCAVYLARTGHSKAYIRNYLQDLFGYDLRHACHEICLNKNDLTSEDAVIQGITVFLETASLTDAIGTAEFYGDTHGCRSAIAGSIAGAFYGVPDALKNDSIQTLPEDLVSELRRIWKASNT